MKKHILLIYPSAQKDHPGIDNEFENGWRNLPIGILSIGTFMKKEGYDVTLLDFRKYEKKEVIKRIKESINENTICVGVSMMTMQIGHGLEIIDYIKTHYELPIIIGGIHATLFPEQTLKDKSVDYIIQGEGEYCFSSLVKFIDKKEGDIKKIKGLGYKIKNKIVINPIGDTLEVKDLPFPDYDLIEDLELYIKRKFNRSDGTTFDTRSLDLHTSRGCPYRCTYCINTLDSFKRWRSKDIKDILDHIDFVIKKYKINFIWFMDDFFFGDISRVKTIAEHIIKKKYKIKWEATIRANLFNDSLVNDELLKILKKSGCYSLGFGFESGSDRILKKIKKGIVTANIVKAVTKCKEYDIMVRGSFMCGFPTETKDEVKATGNLILKLKEIHPKGVYYSPGLLRPYPGAELYQECVTYGFKEPKSLREWGSKDFNFGMYMGHKELPWVKYPNWLRNYQIYLHLATLTISAKTLKKKQSLPYKIFGEISLFRIRRNLYFLPLEPIILIFVRKIVSMFK